MSYVVTQACIDVKDKSCILECPVDCIYEGERMMYIHPDECIDCGACEFVCPTEAIFYKPSVPEALEPFTEANAAFFVDLGSPGGAARIGKRDVDVPYVAGFPAHANDA